MSFEEAKRDVLERPVLTQNNMKDKQGKFKKGHRPSPDTEFKKGDTPWNKGKKGYRPSPDTEFKSGDQHEGENHPSWKGGVQTPKNDCVHVYSGNGKRKRRPRVIYEMEVGEIPKGFIIIHKDGDSTNDLPSNLEAISRAELLKRNNAKNK